MSWQDLRGEYIEPDPSQDAPVETEVQPAANLRAGDHFYGVASGRRYRTPLVVQSVRITIAGRVLVRFSDTESTLYERGRRVVVARRMNAKTGKGERS